VIQSIKLRIRQAVDDTLAPAEFLYRLLTDEVEHREAKQLEQRIRRASFEDAKTLEDVDFQFNRTIPKAKLIDLATCTFIDRHENLLLLGPAGVDKSHIAQGRGYSACRAAYRVLFTPAHEMFRSLHSSRSDASCDRRIRKYARVDLLILDDLGLRTLTGEEFLDLYEIIRRRYEKSSTIMTANREVEEIAPLFSDPLLASAAMDRMLHHRQIVLIEEHSHRTSLLPKQRKQEPSVIEATT
jgi:DNA replication protein DnaC